MQKSVSQISSGPEARRECSMLPAVAAYLTLPDATLERFRALSELFLPTLFEFEGGGVRLLRGGLEPALSRDQVESQLCGTGRLWDLAVNWNIPSLENQNGIGISTLGCYLLAAHHKVTMRLRDPQLTPEELYRLGIDCYCAQDNPVPPEFILKEIEFNLLSVRGMMKFAVRAGNDEVTTRAYADARFLTTQYKALLSPLEKRLLILSQHERLTAAEIQATIEVPVPRVEGILKSIIERSRQLFELLAAEYEPPRRMIE